MPLLAFLIAFTRAAVTVAARTGLTQAVRRSYKRLDRKIERNIKKMERTMIRNKKKAARAKASVNSAKIRKDRVARNNTARNRARNTIAKLNESKNSRLASASTASEKKAIRAEFNTKATAARKLRDDAIAKNKERADARLKKERARGFSRNEAFNREVRYELRQWENEVNREERKAAKREAAEAKKLHGNTIEEEIAQREADADQAQAEDDLKQQKAEDKRIADQDALEDLEAAKEPELKTEYVDEIKYLDKIEDVELREEKMLQVIQSMMRQGVMINYDDVGRAYWQEESYNPDAWQANINVQGIIGKRQGVDNAKGARVKQSRG